VHLIVCVRVCACVCVCVYVCVCVDYNRFELPDVRNVYIISLYDSCMQIYVFSVFILLLFNAGLINGFNATLILLY